MGCLLSGEGKAVESQTRVENEQTENNRLDGDDCWLLSPEEAIHYL